MGDKYFEEYLGEKSTVTAVAKGRNIYVRKDSNHILSDIIHEGTHALDYMERYGVNGLSRWSWEKRAYFYERQFQIATGNNIDYVTINDMLIHIWMNYPNEIYNPY